MEKSDLELRVRRFFDAFCADDWTSFAGLLADDAIYDEEPTRQRVAGRDAFLGVWKEWSRIFGDRKAKLRSLFVSGDTAVVELVWDCLHRDRFQGPFGAIPATGKRARVPAVAVMRFDGDKVAEMRHYFDLLRLLEELGGLHAQPRGAGAAAAAT